MPPNTKRPPKHPMMDSPAQGEKAPWGFGAFGWANEKIGNEAIAPERLLTKLVDRASCDSPRLTWPPLSRPLRRSRAIRSARSGGGSPTESWTSPSRSQSARTRPMSPPPAHPPSDIQTDESRDRSQLISSEAARRPDAAVHGLYHGPPVSRPTHARRLPRPRPSGRGRRRQRRAAGSTPSTLRLTPPPSPPPSPTCSARSPRWRRRWSSRGRPRRARTTALSCATMRCRGTSLGTTEERPSSEKCTAMRWPPPGEDAMTMPRSERAASFGRRRCPWCAGAATTRERAVHRGGARATVRRERPPSVSAHGLSPHVPHGRGAA